MNIYAGPMTEDTGIQVSADLPFAGRKHATFPGAALREGSSTILLVSCRLLTPLLLAWCKGREESVANRTSIGILSVSVWWSSRSSRTLPKQNQSHEQLPTNIRIGLSCITNFLMGRLDPSARFGRIKIWHGTPIALQNDWHFRNFAGTAALCL